jgi:serine/threonine protein kinase
MGHVFMALTGQAGVERVCALKVLKEVRAGRDAEELTQRFLDEAKVVTKLSHENLVYVFDFGIHERQGYLAMEYVQGKSITETWNRCAARRDGFPIGMSIYYIAELVSALWYASNVDGLGLVHRDISPSNVMLTYTGGVKLIDFGLAKWKAKVVQTATGVQWGKTSYMSPEQYMGKPVDHRSDLYSAGVILWELLTGRQMFPPSEPRLPNATVSPPSRHTRDVTPGLDSVVMRALAVHAADRFQSGEEMCAALAGRDAARARRKNAGREVHRATFRVRASRRAAEQRDLVERASRMESDTAADRSERSDPAGHQRAHHRRRNHARSRSRRPGRQDPERPLLRAPVGRRRRHGPRVRRPPHRHRQARRHQDRPPGRTAQIRSGQTLPARGPGPGPDRPPQRRRRHRLRRHAHRRIFFVMEFIDGVSLDAVIKRDGQLSIERALTIAAQICRALEAAHRAGIIHRDLKPSNVMLVRSQDQEELVKVLDFGVAKFLHDTGDGANLTLTDAAVGTPKYMAPEQIRGGGKADFRSDIYALGAILYTMLAGGRLPVEGETVEEIWQHKLTRDPYPLREYRSDLPADLEELVLGLPGARSRGTAKVGHRPQEEAILAHLESARSASDSILGMKSPSQTEILSQRVLKRRARVGMALGTLTAALVAVTGMYFVHWPFSHSNEAPEPTAQVRQGNAAARPPPPAEIAIPAPPPALPTAAIAPPPAPAQPRQPKSLRRRSTQATATTWRGSSGFADQPDQSTRACAKTVPAAQDDERSEASNDEAATAAAKAETAFSAGRLASARMAATDAVAAARKASPDLKVRALIILGKVELASEDFAKAERTFERALAIDPDHPVARKGKERAQEGAAKAGRP